MPQASWLFFFLSLAQLAHAKPIPQPMLQAAALAYAQADFSEAGAVYRALAPQDPEARRNWLGLLFERQGYEALEAATLKPQNDWERLLKARALADDAKWSACLQALSSLEDPQALRLRAEALDAQGSTLAAAAWSRALRLSNKNPGAAFTAFKAACSDFSRGDWPAAEADFKLAERLDGSYSEVHEALAQLYTEEGRYAEAKIRLERALRVSPQDAELRDCLNLLLKSLPHLLADAKKVQEAKEQRRLLRPNPTVVPVPRLDKENVVRVGLLVHAPSFKFKTGGETCLEPEGLVLPAAASYEVSAASGAWTLKRLDDSSALALTLGAATSLDPLDPAATLALFDVGYGAGYFWAGSEDRYYRGELELKLDSRLGVTVVNALPMEAYLQGVLPAEMPADWDKEALKAQAVAARSETLAKLGRYAKAGYDVCPDVLCAVYKGVGGEDPASSAAVQATAGLVLERANGRVLDAVYMDNSGGHTQEPWDAWIGPVGSSSAVYDGPSKSAWAGRFPLGPADLLAYLDDEKNSIDSYCSDVPGQPYSSWRWVARYSREELERSVARDHSIGKLLGVEPLERSQAGFVQRVRFVGSQGDSIGSSDRIRSAIKGLRSNLFYVETRRDAQGQAVEFLFHGGGWGHGVGMSQGGAYAMAEEGFGYKSILRHYYQNASLTRRY